MTQANAIAIQAITEINGDIDATQNQELVVPEIP